MIIIWVCDDNRRMAVLTAKFIEREFIKRKEELRCEIFNNGNELVDVLMKDNKAPDLLFIAVRMKKADGIEVSTKFKEKYCDTLVFFISAFEDALEMAEKYKPFACILKKSLNSEIPYFIDKALLKIKYGKYDALKLICKGRRLFIPVEKISFFLCFKKEIIIHTVDGQEFVVRDTLKRLSGELAGNGFYIINRGVMINYIHVKKLYGRELYLSCGTRFNCSRSGRALIKDKLENRVV